MFIIFYSLYCSWRSDKFSCTYRSSPCDTRVKGVNMKYNIALVKQWAIDRGLHESTLQSQFCKGVEEGGEIFEAILKQDKELFVDAIGDELVVLTILCMIEGIEPEDYIVQLPQEYVSDNFISGSMRADCYIKAMHLGWKQGELARSICKGLPIADNITELVKTLNYLCNICCVDIRECYRIAYKEISKRTGKTIDGVFVKDA